MFGQTGRRVKFVATLVSTARDSSGSILFGQRQDLWSVIVIGRLRYGRFAGADGLFAIAVGSRFAVYVTGCERGGPRAS